MYDVSNSEVVKESIELSRKELLDIGIRGNSLLHFNWRCTNCSTNTLNKNNHNS